MKRLHGIAFLTLLIAFLASGSVFADHIGSHATACDLAGTVGGGTLGLSPGAGVGWSVGTGQCNGSFTTASDATFPGGAIELGLRGEERRVGQVARVGANDYEVELGHDTNAPAATNRAWWNFQLSIAYGGDIEALDGLTLAIRTDVGPNLPLSPLVDLLVLRPGIDDRTGQPNPTAGFAELYQISQNPEFPWFVATPDNDANPTGRFDYDEEGAWFLTLTATENGESISQSICIHTPNAECTPVPVPASSTWSLILMSVLALVGLTAAVYTLRRRQQFA